MVSGYLILIVVDEGPKKPIPCLAPFVLDLNEHCLALLAVWSIVFPRIMDQNLSETPAPDDSVATVSPNGVVETHSFTYRGPSGDGLVFSDGSKMSEVEIAYEVYGEMSAERSNVILLFHANPKGGYLPYSQSHPPFQPSIPVYIQH